MPKAPTPRERVRAEFTREIKDAARRHLAEHGPAGLSMRTLAKDVGLVSASALYRYYPGRDALLTALIADAYDALGEAADAAADPFDGADHADRWLAVCRAVRDWALAHPHEFALVHGSPVPGYTAPEDTTGPGTRLPLLIGRLFQEAAAAGAYRPLGDPAVPAPARAALAPLLDRLPPGTPAHLVVSALAAWSDLLGALALELFGHLARITTDPGAYFDHLMHRTGALLGLASPAASC
ncbi:TetR/AcrR family transcriptional regulator [Kitasatospora cineracea]|uniref:TetR family transcriptional regulator n=1 Tax=Kitasatospora cineracea TaxID=88074 RepID=A0A3N4RWG8_9ACTN|nr:TetR/AcrR family transcriptional regulator [Kitasatospora cineracea]RPE32757.1 TetR family transcriptional regulator [Kitasatospora cineracea]